MLHEHSAHSLLWYEARAVSQCDLWATTGGLKIVGEGKEGSCPSWNRDQDDKE